MVDYVRAKDIKVEKGYFLSNQEQGGFSRGLAAPATFDEASKFENPALANMQYGFGRMSLSQIVPGGVYEFGSGTVTAPGIRWAADTNTGFYWVAAGQFAVSIDGVQEVLFSSSGITIPDLTAGRVVYSGTGGLLSVDAGLLYDASTDILTIGTQLKINAATNMLVFDADAASNTGTLTMATLTAARTWTLPDATGTFAFGTGTANQVAYWSATNTLSGDTGLTYDSVNDKLTITSTAGAQMRLAYDGSNYADFTTSATGDWTVAPSGDEILLFNKSSAGELDLYIINTSNASATANAQLIVRAGGASGGDPAVQWNVSGVTTWTHGIDNSVSGDPFVLSASSALGTSNVVTITTGGLWGIGNDSPSTARVWINHTNYSIASGNSNVFVFTTDAQAADLGGSIGLGGVYTGTSQAPFASVSGRKENSTDANTDGYYSVSVRNNGLGMVERMRIASTGATTIHQWLNVGASAQAVAANDFAAGASSTSLIMWDDSAGEFIVRKTVSGGIVYSEVINNSNTASSSAYFYAQVGGTSAGDPAISFIIPSGATWTAGADTSSSGQFTIAASSVLGTSNVLTATTAGLVSIGTSEAGVVTPTTFATYRAGANYTIIRDTTNDVECLWGAESSGGILGTMTSHALQIRTGNSTRVAIGTSGNVLVGPGAVLTIPDGVGGVFTPQVFNSQTSGIAGMGVGVNDGVNNRRAGLFVNQTSAVWGLGVTYSSGAIPFVLYIGATEYLRIATTGATTIHQWLNVGTATAATAQGTFAAGSTTSYVYWNGTSLNLFNATAASQDLMLGNAGGVRAFEFTTESGGQASLNLRDGSGAIQNIIRGSSAGGGTVFNEQGTTINFRNEGDTLTHFFFLDATATTENAAFFATAAPNWQTMDRGFFVGDTTNAPTGNPSSGGFMYSNAGAGTWRGSGGTTTTFAAAGPHCGSCGYDFWEVCCVNDQWKAELRKCGWCGKVYKKGPKSVLSLLTDEQRAEILNG